MSVGVKSKFGVPDSPSSVNVDHLPFYNPHITELENKPKPILAHDHGAGSPCLVCKDACPGLDLHFWRKVCRACKCKKEAHAVPTGGVDPGHLRIGKLFGTSLAQQLEALHLDVAKKAETSGSRYGADEIRSDVRGKASSLNSCLAPATPYAWVPNDRKGLPASDAALVDAYMKALPEKERPIAGTEGAKFRAKALEHLWPWYDMDAQRSSERGALSEEETGQLERYMALAKSRHVGQAAIARLKELREEEWPAPPTEEELKGLPSPRSADAMSSRGPGACQQCRKDLGPSEVVLTTSHSGPLAVWHPACFVCSHCAQHLVDMLYFYKDGEYFCGRHFGEKMFPRCFGCDELIFSREYTFAEEQNWHLNHFCCLGCDAELGGERYMVRGEQPYCIPCYMDNFARLCGACGKKIGPDAKRISHKEQHWHATSECFNCATCSVLLVGKRFVLKGNRLFCSSECKDKLSKVNYV